MVKRLSKSAIARGLGISPPAFVRYEKRGCPTWSIEAARAWQEQNVHPAQRMWRDQRRASASAAFAPQPSPAPSADELLSEIDSLGERAELEPSPALDSRLRELMQVLPRAARNRVSLPVSVWRHLIGEHALKFLQDLPEPPPGEELPESELVDPYPTLFMLAAGLLTAEDVIGGRIE